MPRPVGRAALLGPAALVVALALTACSSTTTATKDTSGHGNGYVAGASNGGMLPTRVPAPALSGSRVSGNGTLSLSRYAGKVVVLNFYASWCPPCRAETPLLVAIAKAHPSAQFLGVLFEDTPANGRAFQANYAVTFPSIVDRQGVDLAKFKNVNPSGVPDTFVIDKKGEVAAKFVGGVKVKDTATFDKVLATLQAEPA